MVGRARWGQVLATRAGPPGDCKFSEAVLPFFHIGIGRSPKRKGFGCRNNMIDGFNSTVPSPRGDCENIMARSQDDEKKHTITSEDGSRHCFPTPVTTKNAPKNTSACVLVL